MVACKHCGLAFSSALVLPPDAPLDQKLARLSQLGMEAFRHLKEKHAAAMQETDSVMSLLLMVLALKQMTGSDEFEADMEGASHGALSVVLNALGIQVAYAPTSKD